MKHPTPVRLVALFEAFKGVVVLAAATGGLVFIHKDVHGFAVRFIEHLHLNPASRYPQIFIDAASDVGNSHLLLLAFGAAAYGLARLIEAYGLFRERAWAEIFAVGSGAIYVPLEVVELIRRPGWQSTALLLLNLIVVAIMVRALMLRYKSVGRNAG